MSLLTIGTASAQKFYYSDGQRIDLIADSNSMVIYNDGISKNRIVDSTRLLSAFDAQDNRLGKYSVIQTKPSYRPSFSDPSIKYSYSFIKPTGEKLWLTPFIITKLKDGLSVTSLQGILDKYQIELVYKEYGRLHIKCSNISDVLPLANEIFESGNVKWSQPDFLINTTRHQNWEQQYYLNNTNHSYCGFDNDIDAMEAWNLTLGCSDITVAVIDDGVENHPALVDINGNSRVLAGFTPSGVTNNGRPGAGDAHGQACAGIIAASHNSEIRGIAPNVNILPVKVRFGFIPASEYATAIEWAYQNGADIISNSWGGTNEDIIKDAINDAQTFGRGGDQNSNTPGLGSIVTFSSGNDGATQINAYAQVSIAVGALNKFDGLAEQDGTRYSNIGPGLDLVAYGGNANSSGDSDIRTIDRVGANGYNSGDYTNTFGGTSAACPQVSGVAALILSVNPGLTRQQVESILFSTALDLGSQGLDNSFGYGKVNAFEAVKSALSTLGETFHENNGQLALTKINNNTKISFTGKPSCTIASGVYFCDVYRAQTDAVSELEYVRFGGDGLSGANPNNGQYWVNIFLNEDIPGNAPPVTSVRTFFYFIRTNLSGQTINKWVPTDPNSSWSKTYYFNPPEDIVTNQVIENGQNVNLYATNSITLGAGFHAKLGATFLADIAVLPSDIQCFPNPNSNISIPSNGRISKTNPTNKEILYTNTNENQNSSLVEISEIFIYPNPSEGNFVVHLPKSSFEHGYIEIQDIRGVSVYNSEIFTNNQNIKFTEVPGVYIVKIVIDGNHYSKRIILK